MTTSAPSLRKRMQKRKRNRLSDYSYDQPGVYFITVCVKDHKCRLGRIVGVDDHIDPRVVLSRIGIIVEKYTRLIPGDGPMWSSAPTDAKVPTLIRTWKTLISKELGESIFQRSYYDHVIRNEQDYTNIAQYILGNPGKWYEDRYYSEI